jgi:hypothetical protein
MTNALLLSALLPLCLPAAQGAEAADAAKLLPADAFLAVRVESAERLHALAVCFARMGGEEVPADVAALLGDMDVPGDVAQIDPARPAFVALSLGGMSVVPTFVVPARDPQSYATSLAADATLSTAVLGGYVGVSLRPGYAAGTEASALAGALRPGLVSARIDLATLIRTYRPMIEMGLDQMEMFMDQMSMEQQDVSMDMGALLEVYVDGLWDFVDSADQLDLVLDFDGKVVQQRAWLSTLADSPMAELGGEGSFDLRPGAGRIDPDAAFSMLMACDLAKTLERFGPMIDTVLDAYPAEFGGEMKRMVEAYRPLLPLMGPLTSASGDFGQGGMRVSYDLHSPDPAALSGAMRTQLAQLATGAASQSFSIGAPEEVELGGAKALRARLSFDVDALTESLTEGELDQTELAPMQSMMKAIYGDGGLQMVWRPLAGRVALALGGDDAFAAAALAAEPRAYDSLPPELRAAIEAASGGSMGLVYRIDYARILSDMAPMFASLGMDEFDALADKDLRMPVTFWMGIAGTTWSGGAGMDMDQLGALVETMRAVGAPDAPPGDVEDR